MLDGAGDGGGGLQSDVKGRASGGDAMGHTTSRKTKPKVVINHKTVLRLMKVLGLKSLIRLKKYKSYKGEQGKIAPNILQRNFKATAPNQKWATDITEFNISGNKLYLSPIIDLFNGEIISYELSERPNFNQICNMLKKSFKCIPNNSNLILHSDQGWQYQMKQYQMLFDYPFFVITL